MPTVELVVDAKTGKVRQAGATQEGKLVQEFKDQAEKSLYVFAKGVLGLTLLTPTLHLPLCAGLTACPPYRKLRLLPRDHLKTSIIRGLMMHILLQPKESNLYFPSKEGASTRILFAAETAQNAENQLSWISTQYEDSNLLRGLWPQLVWHGNAQRLSKKWNQQAIQLPRSEIFPEASIETIGVGGAVTGRHYDVMVKDDLISYAAANSPTVMHDAVQWHKTSRALLHDADKGLEYMIGTRWAVGDLWQFIVENDPSVDVVVRAAIEDGKPIFPELFSLKTLLRIERELGPALFSLLYMNSAVDVSLTDFDSGMFRYYHDFGSVLEFDAPKEDDPSNPVVKPEQHFSADLIQLLEGLRSHGHNNTNSSI